MFSTRVEFSEEYGVVPIITLTPLEFIDMYLNIIYWHARECKFKSD